MNPGPRWAAHPTPQAPTRSVTKMADRYKATIVTPHGPRTCFEASVEREGSKPLVARFGGIPLSGRRTRSSPTADTPAGLPGRQLVTRLLKGRCELCKQTDNICGAPRPQARRPRQDRGSRSPHGPSSWPRRRRKTLVVCGDCHDLSIGRPTATRSRSSHWRAGCSETGTSGSGAGRAEKDQHHADTSPLGRAYPHRARAVPRRDRRPSRGRRQPGLPAWPS